MDEAFGFGTARRRLAVTGTVQGVGFRPFVFKLAQTFDLKGFVCNSGGAVIIEVEGQPQAVQKFELALLSESPVLSKIDGCIGTFLSPRLNERAFAIVASTGSGAEAFSKNISPDSATCSDCLYELFNRDNRRYRYPFTNCTNCGPRFTILEGFPYDRHLTTMASFSMCALCAAEYADPTDRRFHAQPNACASCGPQLQFWVAGAIESRDNDDAIAKTVSVLKSGGIVAVKGLGGFHLACDAANRSSVDLLRQRKRRSEKPFAVMYPSIAAVDKDCFLSSDAKSELQSNRRPVVLCRRKTEATVCHSVAPGLDSVGVMLPYTPLHHVLLEDFGGKLVMTSANLSEEPICADNDDAIRTLSTLTDAILLHNRDIAERYDDSIVTTGASGPIRIFRRARGYAPEVINLSGQDSQVVLAVGAQLKNTFCIRAGEKGYVSQHIGDLNNLDSVLHLEHTLGRFLELFDLRPELIACDLHPDYASSRLAHELAAKWDLPVVAVQHHHAHIAACLAEHGVFETVLGLALDGLGYGPDGTMWGGEFLLCSQRAFRRVAHFETARLVGGNAAVRAPWRMALSYLQGLPEQKLFVSSIAADIKQATTQAVLQLMRNPLLWIETSSCGRLFDAVAAVSGMQLEVSYEGQAAMQLEAAAVRGQPEASEAGGFNCFEPHEPFGRSTNFAAADLPAVLPVRQLVAAAVRERAAGVSPETVAWNFHVSLATLVAQAAVQISRASGVDTVCLSGGVFQNMLFLDLISTRIKNAGLKLLVPAKLPCNDGGISLGQSVVAGFAR